MRTPLSFANLSYQAWELISHSRTLALFAIPFGILGALSVQVSGFFSQHLPKELSWSNLTTTLVSSDWVVNVTLIVLTLGVIRSLLRGPLFLLVRQHVSSHSSLENSLKQPTLFHGALISLKFETLYWLSGIIIAGIILIPFFLALRHNEGVAASIGQIGFILLVVLLTIFFYIKEFALCYRLFTKAHARLSVELGLKLFRQHVFMSLLFGLFLIALSFVFTFVINLAMIASDLIGHAFLETGVSLLLTASILGGAAIFEETLRVFFFHALAGAPKLPLPKLEKLIEEKAPDSAPTI